MGTVQDCYSISGSSPRSDDLNSSGKRKEILERPGSPCLGSAQPSTGPIYFSPSSQSPQARPCKPEISPAYSASSNDPGHVIFPRRKVGDGIFSSSPAPIVVTIKTLEDLRGYPLVSAAEKLGVSSTALKRACRALGIRRWSYQKLSPNIRAKAMRRVTNAAKSIVVQAQSDDEKIEPAATEAALPGEAFALSWMVAPRPLSGEEASAGEEGLETEIKLEEEGEELMGESVFEWPRYA